MRAVWYERPGSFSLVEREDPAPGPGEVRLRVRSSGVCGTDVHLHHGGFSPRYPFTPGHEVVGEVESLGEGVDGLDVGRLVALDNRIACGTCRSCRRALPMYCTRLRDLGVTEPGGASELLVAPAGQCHDVDDLPLEVTALAEPVACAVHAVDVLGPSAGGDVLVLGAGTAGLVLAQLLARTGAWRLVVAGPTASKLDLARAAGATRTVLLDRDDPDGTTGRLRAEVPDGYDVVVDATGAPALQERSIGLVRDGGTVLLYGMAPEEATIAVSPNEVFRRQLTVQGSFTQAYSFDRAVAALRSGVVRTDGMVTHHYGLDDYGAALDAVSSDRSAVKVLVHP